MNLKTREFLTRPNHVLFKILETLEICFIKHAVSLNPFEGVYETFFQINGNTLTFPCEFHKSNVLTKSICLLWIGIK